MWVVCLSYLAAEHDNSRLDIKSDISKQVFDITDIEPVAMYRLETYTQHLGYWVTVREHIDDYVRAETRAKVKNPMFGTLEMSNILHTKVDGVNKFETTIKGKKLNCKFTGVRNGDELTIDADFDGSKQTIKVPYDGNPFLAGLDVLKTPKDIKVGSNWKMNVLNPMAKRMENVTVVVTKFETIVLRAKDNKTKHIECMRIEAKAKSMSLIAWVDKDNRTIKQTISTGAFEITAIRLLDKIDENPFELLNKE